MADPVGLLLSIPFLFWFLLAIGIVLLYLMRRLEKRNEGKIRQDLQAASEAQSRAGEGSGDAGGTRWTIVPHDLFISYAAEDKQAADAMCATLEARGIRCWAAPRDVPPGMDPGQAVTAAIDSSRVVVVIFTSHSNSSLHVNRELSRALHDGITIIPFRLEDVQPSSSMEYLIGVPHWLDAITPPLRDHLSRLAEVVEGHLRTP
jgi:hypothetical protein